MRPSERDINRFVEAQASGWSGYDVALREIENGSKDSHWMWYIFPQYRNLGRSSTARYYGIENRAEAEQYLVHETLGPRLREICTALLKHRDKSAVRIMGSVDALKLRSSMTMFDCISPNDIFGEVLDVFYDGERCDISLRIDSLG